MVCYHRSLWGYHAYIFIPQNHIPQASIHQILQQNLDEATISILFNNFIAALHDYEYVGWMPEALDECTYLTLLHYLIKPVANLRWNINISERVESKGVGFIPQKVMDFILEYFKVPVTIQYYSKAQSYSTEMRTPSEPRYNRHNQRHADLVATASYISEEVPGLKTNDDSYFLLDGKFTRSRRLCQKTFILGSYLDVFGMHAGRRIWIDQLR